MKKIFLLAGIGLLVLQGMGQSIAGAKRLTETQVKLPSGTGFFYIHYEIEPGYQVWQVYDSFVDLLKNKIGCDWLTVNSPSGAADYYFIVHHAENKTGETRTLRIRASQSMCMITQYAPLKVYSVSGNSQTRTVILSGSEPNVRYRLKSNDVVVETKSGTGGNLLFAGGVPAGTYTVEAEREGEVKAMQGKVTFAPAPDNKIITTTYRQERGIAAVEDITFYDGLGRVIQRKSRNATPGKKDWITPVVPDFLGRETCTYLAYPAASSVSSYTSTALTDQASYYSSRFGSGGSYPYREKRYEASALNRVKEESKPGEAYRCGGGHTVRYTYGTNGKDEVKHFGLGENDNVILCSYYEAETLYRTDVTDEDGRRNTVYTDGSGNKILERQYADASHTVETYYVYDGLDRLVCVIPPMISGESVISPTDLENYAYRYVYNAKGELSSKKLPGIVKETYIYDGKHQLLSKTAGEKHFSYEYDALGRIIREKCRYGNSTTDMILSEYAYKNRPADNALNFTAMTGFATFTDERTTGLKVYEKLRILDSRMQDIHKAVARYIERAFYYDRKGRLIQTVEKNQRGGIGRYCVNYSFSGNVLMTQESHTVGGLTTTVKQVNTYDSRDRLLSQTVYLEDTKKAEVSYFYNELGQLQEITYGDNLYTDTRTYNLRGGLTRQTGTQFEMNLRYENPTRGKACYNGNISEWECTFSGKPAQLYTFAYDGLNRFTGNDRYENDVKNPTYTEQNILYDKNGNLLNLRRIDGRIAKTMAYRYTGNRLTGLSINQEEGSYTYDIYGNMLTDSRKALNLQYNFLNLLTSVTKNGIEIARYEYASDGTKLSVSGTDGQGYEYYGSSVYRRNGSSLTFESAGFNEGRILPGGVYYYVKDPLGNVRAVLDQAGSVKEQNDYYPFGLRQERSDYALLAGSRFKYNGKEEQTTGNLGYLDYGARMYDAGLGRWFGADPQAEKHYNQGVYNYCADNPVNHIDIGGRDWFPSKEDDETDNWFFNFLFSATGGWIWKDVDSYIIYDENFHAKKVKGYKAVVVFEGSLSESLGTKSNHQPGSKHKNNAYINGSGAVTASVTVYGPGGKEDIKTYTGYTMSSDDSKYGIVKDGQYGVNHVNKDDNLGPYDSPWTLNSRGRVSAYWDNPNRPDQIDKHGKAYLTGVFIHRTNNDGWAGVADNSSVSKGCLLISPSDWNSFNTQLSGITYFRLEVRRTTSVYNKLPHE